MVEVEDLGSFRLSVKATATESPEEVSQKQISSPGISFRPSKELKNELKAAKFEKRK